MPNTGHKWTEEEENDAVDFDYETFRFLHPEVSYDAYRLRRSALIRSPKVSRNRFRAFVHRLVCG